MSVILIKKGNGAEMRHDYLASCCAVRLLMMDDSGRILSPHNLVLEDRKKLSLSGVTDVDSFDETTIIAYTDYGELTINGTSLHICKLNIDEGELCVDGNICAMTYIDKQPKNQGFFGKIFR